MLRRSGLLSPGARLLWGLMMLGLEKAYFLGGVLRRALIRPRSIEARVVSVGNLVFGGSGKTPIVGMLALLLKEKGHPCGIVLKGYGGKRRYEPLIVSDGHRVLARVQEAGDEALFLAYGCPQIPVAIGKNRFKAAVALKELFGATWIVVDDGFSQPYLQKDLELLVLTGDEFERGPLSMDKHHLLREPLKAIERAHALILPQGLSPQKCAMIESWVLSRGLSIPVLRLFRNPEKLLDLRTREQMPLDALKGERIVGLAGIGRPMGFFKTLERLYGPLDGNLAFKDHEPYTEREVRRLIEASDGKRLVCTMKDAVKLLAFQHLIPQGRIVALMESVRLEPKDTLKKLLFGEAR